MGGICGVVFKNQENKYASGFDIRSMVQALTISEELQHGQIGRGAVYFGANWGTTHSGGVVERKLQGESVLLCFEGTIYDMDPLIAYQKARGEFVEGIMEMYLNDGIDACVQLQGEFSLAIFDSKISTFYLATDRFRVRPLFYFEDREKIVFGSRMASLTAFPGKMELSVDPQAVVDIVGSSAIPTPRTIYREVKKLPPAHIMSFRKNVLMVKPYWNFNFMQQSMESEECLSQRLKTTLREAISSRVAIDKESRQFGTFLSGGVDSSTITGLITQVTGNPVSSFSIGFGEPKFNEMEYARLAAETYGAQHHEYYVTPSDVQSALPLMLEVFDEPFANASAVPTYFCAKLAKEHGMDVLYAGDGGDELFAGNERYATQQLFDYYFLLPKRLRQRVVEPLVLQCADFSFLPLFQKGKKYIQRAKIPYPDRLSSYGFFREIPLEEIFTPVFLEEVGVDYDPYESIRRHYFEARAKNNLDRQLYVDFQLIISDNDLFKVTRMTECAGIGVRYPFLDYRVAELAAQVPAGLKMRGRKLRSFFKNTYVDLLPVSTQKKQKHGFGLPIPIWLREDRHLNSIMHELVLGERTMRRSIFRKETMENLVARHKTDPTSFFGTALWNLMILELWFRKSEECQKL